MASSPNEIRIPFVQLRTERKKEIYEEVLKGIESVFESSQYILGDAVDAFEKQFAEAAGSKFAVGVNSGTDALYLALLALGIKPGDEVITAPNSFVGSAGAIAVIGARPVFSDVDETYNLDPNLLEKAITPKTKAIIPVHLCGYPAKMDQIMEIANRYGLKVVEDSAQSVLATLKGKKVGNFGDVGCFSLHPLKNLHIWGDGGMMTMQSHSLYEKLKIYRNHGLINRNESEIFSFNSRLDTIQAVVGLASLKQLEETTKARQKNAALYDEKLRGLSEFVTIPVVDKKNAVHVFHVYVIRAKKRDELANFLLKRGIETKIHYPIPIHLQKAAKYLGYKMGDFPVTEKFSQEILSLPVRENLTESEISEVVDAISEFYH